MDSKWRVWSVRRRGLLMEMEWVVPLRWRMINELMNVLISDWLCAFKDIQLISESRPLQWLSEANVALCNRHDNSQLNGYQTAFIVYMVPWPVILISGIHYTQQNSRSPRTLNMRDILPLESSLKLPWRYIASLTASTQKTEDVRHLPFPHDPRTN